MFFNIKTWYDGRLYDSKLEARYAEKLAWQKARGEIRDVEPQVKFPLFLNGVKDCDHIADFVVTHTNGKKEVHEVKGREEPKWLRKLSLFVENYPQYPYITVKDNRGRFAYFSSAEILDRAGLVSLKSSLPPKKQYAWWEVALSGIVHHLAALFFD